MRSPLLLALLAATLAACVTPAPSDPCDEWNVLSYRAIGRRRGGIVLLDPARLEAIRSACLRCAELEAGGPVSPDVCTNPDNTVKLGPRVRRDVF